MTEGRHIAIITDEAPPIWYRNKRTIRTIIQVIVSTAVTIAITIVTLASFAPEVLDALTAVLPESAIAWLTGAVAFLVALSGALARIMAIPAVNDFLTRFGAGSVPKSTVER